MNEGSSSSGSSDSEVGFLFDVFDDAIDPGGFHIEGYEIIRELDRGGMGIVYLAKQLNPERELALKVMLPHYADKAEMRARFYTEVSAMASLDHPGILPIYEVSESDGFQFFSMKLAKGGSLAERLLDNPLPPRKASQLIREIADALHHAHQRGVLHRDLKPANFLFSSSGQVYVSDFGVAKITDAKSPEFTQSNAFVGTPHYLPPEVAGGFSKATIAGDIYSLGAVLYECLLGQKVFSQHENFAGLLRAIVDEPITAPRALDTGIPKDLETICLKALSKNPADRYSSAEELSSDLARWETGMPIYARPLGLCESLWRLIKRHTIVSALILAFVLLAATSIGVVVNERLKARENIQLRLHESLLGQAKTERLLGQPGFRVRVFSLLQQAWELSPSPRIETEAIATLTKTDFVVRAGSPETRLGNDKIWPPSPRDDRQVSMTHRLPEYGQALVFYHSGSAAIWVDEEESPRRIWRPTYGQSVIADFLPNGEGLLVTGSQEGITLCSRDASQVDSRFPNIKGNPRFLTVSPEGNLAAFGGSEGLHILDLEKREWVWTQEGDVVRCPPLWTPDGRYLVVALGEKKIVQILKSEDGTQALTLKLSDWPERFACDPQTRYLAVALDSDSVSIFDLLTELPIARLPLSASDIRFSENEQILLVSTPEGKEMRWSIEEAIGYHEWPREQLSASSLSGAELSPDGQWLLISHTEGIEIYSIAERRQTAFYSTENQRIDAPTSAWWLPDRDGQILLQVPGAWEVMQVDSAGALSFSHHSEAKLPGTRVKAILPKGDWLVEERDEDGGSVLMRWPAGNSDQAVAAKTRLLSELRARGDSILSVGIKADLLSDGRIQISGKDELILTPPRAIDFEKLLLTIDGERLLGIGADHQIVEWNLGVLNDELVSQGFDYSGSR